LTLAINSLVDLEEVWSRSWSLAFTDPLAERWFAVPVDDCEFPEEGSYEVELAADGDPIGRALLQVSVQG
jgi:hypothetical protein